MFRSFFPAELGEGRFAKIGFANPEFLADLLGRLEIICGALIIIGLLTRLASFPIVIIMLTAISIKLGILERNGLWKMLQESRINWAMLLGSIFYP